MGYIIGNAACRRNVRIKDDAGMYTNSVWYIITGASHCLEIHWAAASAAGANDGYISLRIDGVLQQTISGVDNDTLRIEQARFGPLGSLDAGTSGTEYFDAFESRRQTYIGPLSGGGLLGGAAWRRQPTRPNENSRSSRV